MTPPVFARSTAAPSSKRLARSTAPNRLASLFPLRSPPSNPISPRRRVSLVRPKAPPLTSTTTPSATKGRGPLPNQPGQRRLARNEPPPGPTASLRVSALTLPAPLARRRTDPLRPPCPRSTPPPAPRPIPAHALSLPSRSKNPSRTPAIPRRVDVGRTPPGTRKNIPPTPAPDVDAKTASPSTRRRSSARPPPVAPPRRSRHPSLR